MQVTFPHMMATLPIAQMTDGQTRQVLAIPGIKPIKNQIRVPWHAVPLLVGMLQSWRLEHSTPAAWVVPPPNPVTWEEVDAHLRALGEVRPEFLGDFPLVYQKRALSRFALSSNCHLWHATGAGKTFTSMLWALIAKGTILVVTRSAARFQYAREWRRFTHLNPYVLKSKSARRKRDQSLPPPPHHHLGREPPQQEFQALEVAPAPGAAGRSAGGGPGRCRTAGRSHQARGVHPQ
jgi:hypothetical protein